MVAWDELEKYKIKLDGHSLFLIKSKRARMIKQEGILDKKNKRYLNLRYWDRMEEDRKSGG